MFSRPKFLFLVSLLFVALLNLIPTYLLNLEFFIILVWIKVCTLSGDTLWGRSLLKICNKVVYKQTSDKVNAYLHVNYVVMIRRLTM